MFENVVDQVQAILQKKTGVGRNCNTFLYLEDNLICYDWRNYNANSH